MAMLHRKEAKSISKRMNALNTTPVIITPAVAAFCGELSTAEPLYVPVRPAQGAEPNNCHLNVPALIAQAGGTLVNGWTIWLWPRVVITAEFHAVWRNPAGELVDITPKRERRILFVPDPERTYDGVRVPNVYKPLNAAPVVAEWIGVQLKLGDAIKVGPQLVSHALIQLNVRGMELTSKLLKL